MDRRERDGEFRSMHGVASYLDARVMLLGDGIDNAQAESETVRARAIEPPEALEQRREGSLLDDGPEITD